MQTLDWPEMKTDDKMKTADCRMPHGNRVTHLHHCELIESALTQILSF